MLGGSEQFVTVQASLEGYNGIIRLLGDAERFGLGLAGLTVAPAQDDAEAFCLTAVILLPLACGLDGDQLAARLSRHPAVISLEVHEHEANSGPGCASSEAVRIPTLATCSFEAAASESAQC